MNTVTLDLNIQLPEHGRVGEGGISESGSFWSYSRSVRSFWPGSFRPDFWGESFWPGLFILGKEVR